MNLAHIVNLIYFQIHYNPSLQVTTHFGRWKQYFLSLYSTLRVRVTVLLTVSVYTERMMYTDITCWLLTGPMPAVRGDWVFGTTPARIVRRDVCVSADRHNPFSCTNWCYLGNESPPTDIQRMEYCSAYTLTHMGFANTLWVLDGRTSAYSYVGLAISITYNYAITVDSKSSFVGLAMLPQRS